MQNQWAWLKSQAGERSSLVADLLDKLRQFNQQHGDLRAFVTSGQELLATEHPVGNSAARIEEQMETCQVCTNVHGVHVYFIQFIRRSHTFHIATYRSVV